MLDMLGAGIGAIGNIAAASIQANAARDAAEQQEALIAQGLQKANGYYGQAASAFNPYTTAGASAASSLPGMVAGLKQPGFDYTQTPFSFDANSDPGAQYAMNEAAKALNASSIASGAMGGGAQKAMATEMTNLGQTNYQNAYQRWLQNSQMGFGQAEAAYNRNLGFQKDKIAATQGVAQMGETGAQGQANILNNQAQAQFAPYAEMGGSAAAGTLGSANSLANGIGGVVGNVANYLGRASTPQTPAQTWNPSAWTVPSAPASNPYASLGAGLSSNNGGF